MTDLPPTVRVRPAEGQQPLATRRPSETDDDPEWRHWPAERSKLAAMILSDLPISINSTDNVLYLGAATGTTVDHVAAATNVVYAVEFAPAPMRQLLSLATTRDNILPLLKDARRPERYAHVVEADLDLLIQDLATRRQAQAALANRRFLRDGGRLYCAFKARSVDVTADPREVFDTAVATLQEGYEIIETAPLDAYHTDHLGVVARPRG